MQAFVEYLPLGAAAALIVAGAFLIRSALDQLAARRRVARRLAAIRES